MRNVRVTDIYVKLHFRSIDRKCARVQASKNDIHSIGDSFVFIFPSVEHISLGLSLSCRSHYLFHVSVAINLFHLIPFHLFHYRFEIRNKLVSLFFVYTEHEHEQQHGRQSGINWICDQMTWI